jgi:hypothetical protein
MLPLTADLVGAVLVALLSMPAALFGLTLFCSNYYRFKYCQQVKQYGTDFLATALLIVLVRMYVESRSQRHSIALLVAGAAGLFLSYTAEFWLTMLLISAPSIGGPPT